MFDVTASPARFMGVSGPPSVLVVMASHLNVFFLWGAVIVAIGLHVIGRVPKTQAYMAAGMIWLVTALPQIFGALSQGR